MEKEKERKGKRKKSPGPLIASQTSEEAGYLSRQQRLPL